MSVWVGAIFFRVIFVTKRPKIQSLEHSKYYFSHNNLKQELRARVRSGGLGPCSFSETQASCLPVIFKYLPGHNGGFYHHSNSQKDSMSIEECTCWGSLSARPGSHTHCFAHPVGEELITWPYLIAREARKCYWACGYLFLWKERVNLSG